jgi:hypothetical protein
MPQTTNIRREHSGFNNVRVYVFASVIGSKTSQKHCGCWSKHREGLNC